jgi:sigma-B regulation protein RsbU (phosphoserine phosphatase)
MNILIADDEPISLCFLQFQLQRCGHVVHVARDGTQAWEMFQNHDFQVVITDWEMPGMTGIELIQKIRAVNREAYVWIILLTSKSEQEELITGLVTGADTFLTKPIRPEELQARLQSSQRLVGLERRLAERQRELEDRHRRLAAANAKMKRDLEAAAMIQQQFLPKRLVEFPDIHFAWHYSPCNELAGDMLNILPLDEDRVAVYVLDVSGHGVQAALIAVVVSRFLSSVKDESSVLWQRQSRSHGYELASPATVLEHLNARLIAQSFGEQFLSICYGIFDRRTGEFRYAIGGHPPPVLASKSGEVRLLCGDGLPIGIAETDYDEGHVQLQPGDRLLLYSDGVTETMNLDEKFFGHARLLQSARREFRHSLQQSLSNLVKELDDWRGNAPKHDDLSLLALEFAPQRKTTPHEPCKTNSFDFDEIILADFAVAH